MFSLISQATESRDAGEIFFTDRSQNMRMQLAQPTAVKLAIHDHAGSPQKGIRVRPALLRLNDNERWWLPDGLSERLSQVTNENGEVTIADLPPGMECSFDVDVPSLGRYSVGVARQPTKTVIALPPLGKVTGRAVDPVGEPVANIRVAVWVEPIETTYPVRHLNYHADRVTDRDGSFVIDSFPACTANVWIRSNENMPYLTRIIRIAIQANQTTHVEIPLVEAVRAHGKVVDEESGAPVAGVACEVSHSQRFSDRARSDEEGNFHKKCFWMAKPSQCGALTATVKGFFPMRRTCCGSTGIGTAIGIPLPNNSR